MNKETMQYEILRDCWLSGQISDLEMHQRMEADPHFASWMVDQAKEADPANIKEEAAQ